MNPNAGRFWTMDTDEGNREEPLSLHKYLYCKADPANRIDPSGLFSLFKFSKEFGDEAHRIIEGQYQAENPGAILGSTTGILGPLKPDIFNPIKQTFGDVKPLSLSGVTEGVLKIGVYEAYYGIGKGYSRETWPNGLRGAHVFGTPIAFWNVLGIIFYTDETSNVDDLIKITTLAAARAFIRSGLASRTLLGAAGRIGGLVVGGQAADPAEEGASVGIATLITILL